MTLTAESLTLRSDNRYTRVTTIQRTNAGSTTTEQFADSGSYTRGAGASITLEHVGGTVTVLEASNNGRVLSGPDGRVGVAKLTVLSYTLHD